MQVKIKLYRGYREYLTEDILLIDGVAELELTEGSTVRDVLEQLKIPEKVVKILMVNSKPYKLDDELIDQDYIFIFPPVAGG